MTQQNLNSNRKEINPMNAAIIEIIAGVLTGVLTISGTILANIIQSNKRDELQDERLKHIEQTFDERSKLTERIVLEKIDNLREKVEKHNQVTERMYKLESKVENLEKRG
jgi:CRISPR/Cas system-associated endonuclease Cas1